MSDIVERLTLIAYPPAFLTIDVGGGKSIPEAHADLIKEISRDAINEIENLRNVAQQRLTMCIAAGNENERLRAQVADLTRIAGCVAVAGAVEVPVKTFDDIKREIKKNA